VYAGSKIVVAVSKNPLSLHWDHLNPPVFMDSIQIASTGPSSTIHFLSGEASETAARISALAWWDW
jgi:hypothetical protein